MLSKLLRENKVVSAVLAVVRIYLGYAWFTAGIGKLTGGFDASGFLANAANNPVKGPDGVVYGWYATFLKEFALPNAELFNFVIPWGETLVGLGLMLGMLTTAAMFFGLLMNFSFLLAGTVSHNPTDILMGVIILTSGYNAGRYGLDYWVIAKLRELFKGKPKNDDDSSPKHLKTA